MFVHPDVFFKCVIEIVFVRPDVALNVWIKKKLLNV